MRRVWVAVGAAASVFCLLASSQAEAACKQNAFGAVVCDDPVYGGGEPKRDMMGNRIRSFDSGSGDMGLGGYKRRSRDDTDYFGRPRNDSGYGAWRDSTGVYRPNASDDCKTDVTGVRRCR